MPHPEPVCLVTGSARGIGREIARALSAAGRRVHVVWRSSASEVEGLEAEFAGRVHRADLARGAEVQALVDGVLERDGRLDVLVHAVGDVVFGPLAQLRAEQLEHLVTNNLTSAFHLVQAARAPLRASRGNGLFLGCAGIESLRARTATAAYTAAKTALLVFMRSLAREEAPFGVRFNMISPGLVPHAAAHEATLDAERIASIPLGRPGTGADLAQAALWLTSEDAGHVTGQNLDVAGGYLL